MLRHNPPPPPKSRMKSGRRTGHADADPQMIEARAVYEQTNERMAEIIDEIDGYDIVYRLLTKADKDTMKAQRNKQRDHVAELQREQDQHSGKGDEAQERRRYVGITITTG